MLCPKCKTDNAHRSHRVGLRERLTGIVGYHAYRCHHCSHRFLSLHYLPAEPTAPAARGRVEREIAHTQGALRWKRKRRNILIYGSALILFVFILYFLTREPSIGT
jgi:DNA-directed RNA polymerase subunit RPC12/RpoP